MRKLLFLIPIFLFAGINDSYAFKKGYQEGKNIKMRLFNKSLSLTSINKICLEIYERDAKKNRYIKDNKEIFLKGCKEALTSF